MVDDQDDRKGLAARLRQARANAGFKSAMAATKKFGWPYQTYKNHENGERRYRLPEAKIYGDAFGVSPGWLLAEEGGMPAGGDGIKRIPLRLIPLMKASSYSELQAVARGSNPIGYADISVASIVDLPPRSFGYEVEGDAMANSADKNSLGDGDVAVVAPGQPLDPGCFVLVLHDNKTMVRRYKPTSRDGFSFDLVPLNSFHLSISTNTMETEIIGRVVMRISAMM